MFIKENIELLKGLQTRVSVPRLTDPAPSDAQLAECYKAAFRSPDHGWMRPWRFIECRGEERTQLGETIARAMTEEHRDLDPAKFKKFSEGPLRAPLVIIAYAKTVDNPKVPEIEQVLATGCAVNNLATALYAAGYGSVWRTGDPAYSRSVHTALHLSDTDKIVGFLYVGTPVFEPKGAPILERREFVSSLTDHLV